MKLHVFPPSPNSRKVLFANAALGLDLPVEIVDLTTGAQSRPEFLSLNPNGKVPVLEYDDGGSLWESNAIIDRMAAVKDTEFWPKSNARYDIMRWQFWESCHWLPALSPFISRHVFGNETVDLDRATEEARRFATVLDTHLAGRDWLAGDTMTTADISVSAVLTFRETCHFPLDGFTNLDRWFARIAAMEAWHRSAPEALAA